MAPSQWTARTRHPGAPARLAGRKPVIVRPPPEAVLEKHHVVPTAPRRDLAQLLRHELARITPFPADDLFWRWDGRPKTIDKNRTDVTLTMVPKATIAAALDTLANIGIRPRFIETGPADRPRLLTIDDEATRTTGHVAVRGLAWTCAGLAVIALVLPVLLQELALYSTNSAIDDPVFLAPQRGPTTRFQGSKHKLLGWLWQHLEPLPFHTCLDAFSGSACVSHFLKRQGKAVTCNDVLMSGALNGVAVPPASTALGTRQVPFAPGVQSCVHATGVEASPRSGVE